MEKYLVVLIITIICYYIFRHCIQLEVEKMKEGFANTLDTSDPDLVKSITTLAQVCKDLQKDGLKVPGNLTVTGTIKTGDDLDDIASRLTKLEKLLSSMSLFQIKTGNDLYDIASRLTKLEKLPSSMRLFQMTLDNTWDRKVVDSDNIQFNSNEWVCSVQGLSMNWTVSTNEVKAIYQFCYIKDNEWWIKSVIDKGTQIGKPVILAIPKSFFVKNDISIFK